MYFILIANRAGQRNGVYSNGASTFTELFDAEESSQINKRELNCVSEI